MTTLLLTLATLNVAVAGYYTFAAIRYRRAVARIRVLDMLLTHLCAQAYIRDHEPVWMAMVADRRELYRWVIARRKEVLGG